MRQAGAALGLAKEARTASARYDVLGILRGALLVGLIASSTISVKAFDALRRACSISERHSHSVRVIPRSRLRRLLRNVAEHPVGPSGRRHQKIARTVSGQSSG